MSTCLARESHVSGRALRQNVLNLWLCFEKKWPAGMRAACGGVDGITRWRGKAESMRMNWGARGDGMDSKDDETRRVIGCEPGDIPLDHDQASGNPSKGQTVIPTINERSTRTNIAGPSLAFFFFLNFAGELAWWRMFHHIIQRGC